MKKFNIIGVVKDSDSETLIGLLEEINKIIYQGRVSIDTESYEKIDMDKFYVKVSKDYLENIIDEK